MNEDILTEFVLHLLYFRMRAVSIIKNTEHQDLFLAFWSD